MGHTVVEIPVPFRDLTQAFSDSEIARISERLPVAVRAQAVALTHWATDAIETIALFPLGEHVSGSAP